MRRARLHVQREGHEEIHALDGQAITVGRSAENAIHLPDARVSRFHLKIEPQARGYRVVDNASQNGTWRNGKRIRSAALAHGDVLAVGGARITYEEGDEEAPTAGSVTVTVSAPQTAEYTRPTEALVRRMRRLAEITRVLSAGPAEEGLLDKIIDAAVELTGSERGFLIESRKDGMRFAAARNFHQEDQKKPEFEVSWSIAISVGTSGESTLLINAQDDDRFGSLESVEQLGLRSVLCVPVKGVSRIMGVIYVDNRLQKGAYLHEDQDLLQMLADQAGIALTNRQLMADLVKRSEEVFDLNQRLQAQVDRQGHEIKRMRAALGDGPESGYVDYRVLIGGSARMDELRHLLQKVALTNFPVLIQGESGTGKELVSRCIHHNSPRAKGAFVSINCAAIPETLLENELFGHARGAFTGADQPKKGLFEVAHGGTLFLDEVSEMSAAMQSRLLRVLQEGEVRPVGGKEPIHVDVRIIAASNRDIAEMVARGTFREDLYYRLRVLPVLVPPLRERREDIPDLIGHLFKKHTDGKAPAMDPEALDVLCSYAWPGNVRELENEVKRLSVLAGARVDRTSLSRQILEAGEMLVGKDSGFQDLGLLVESVETREIKKALVRTRGNKTKAADLLGITRFTLQRKLDKYGLVADDNT